MLRHFRVPPLYPLQAAQRPTSLFTALSRTRPIVDGGLATARETQFVGRGVGGDRGARADGRTFADPHRCDQRSVGTDERAIADFGNELVDAVVVTGDGAGADVDPGADLGVAEIGEMVGLAAFAQLRS